jgi:hypothetical protein
MAQPSHVGDSVRELLEGSDSQDWSIRGLHSGILATGLSALTWLEWHRVIGKVGSITSLAPPRAVSIISLAPP